LTHPILQDLNWRHTVKKYDPSRKITKANLDVFFEALRLSASSINSQPWRFIVIDSDAARKRMGNTFTNKFQFNQPHIFDSSQIILFAHNPRYSRDDYAEVVDKGISDGRTRLQDREGAFGGFIFAELNTDENGNTAPWTKAQLYISLGNALHTLARLNIGATPLEGIDTELVNKEFKTELGGYQCDVALAIGYSHPEDDFNAKLPKSRRSHQSVFVHI